MGILDELLGAIFGSRQAAPDELDELPGKLDAAEARKASVMAALMALVQEDMGGIEGVLQRFRQAGLGDLADSWLATSPNAPLSPAQLQQVFGTALLGKLAEQADLSAQEASVAASELLPDLVDRLSPQGALNIQHVAVLHQGLSMLRGIRRR